MPSWPNASGIFTHSRQYRFFKVGCAQTMGGQGRPPILRKCWRCVLYNGVRKRPRVRPVSPAHLVNILVTAVSWLSIIVVGGGVSSLLRDKHSEPMRQWEAVITWRPLLSLWPRLNWPTLLPTRAQAKKNRTLQKLKIWNIDMNFSLSLSPHKHSFLRRNRQCKSLKCITCKYSLIPWRLEGRN